MKNNSLDKHAAAGLAAIFLCISLVSGCNGSGDGTSTRFTQLASLSQPVAKGENCAGPYGNPPRPLTSSVDGLIATTNLCTTLGGEILSWTDGDGNSRFACLSVPANAQVPLPLLVWIHPSLFPIDTVRITDIFVKQNSADLSGDPARPGFILLLPAGRDTQHFYPFPDDTGLGWDNWYRNFNRADPAINVDVATIDHFIQATKDRGIVDRKRIFLSGWSNGSAMAILYGLNTPGIAAAAVYSSPNPFGDLSDPCAQAPFGNNHLPIYHVHNDCDIFGICPGGEALFEGIRSKKLSSALQDRIINSALLPASSCNSLCDPGQPLGETLGTTNHLRWPYNWTDELLAFLRDHPLEN